MRNLIPLFLILIILFNACTKTGTTATTTPGGGNPPPGGGNSGITISGVSPLMPYPGDEITITGTGFDADPTKDTVTFVLSDGINITNIYFVSYSRWKITSATTTQIKFVIDSGFLFPPGPNQMFAVHITAPLKSAVTKNILSLKKKLSFGVSSMDFSPTPGCLAIYTGDSIFLTGEGFYPPFRVSINGVATNITLDANSTTSARGFIPFTFFGASNQILCTDDKYYAIKAENGDGRTFTNPRYFFLAPNSELNQPFPQGATYSRKSTSSVVVNLTGYALRNDYYLELTSKDNASGTTFTENLLIPVSTDFPNKGSFSIDLGAFPTPTSSSGSDFRYILRIGSSASAPWIGFGIAFTVYP